MAASDVFTNNIPPPGVSTDDYVKWQRQQMLAKALLGDALSPIQAPETQPVRGLYTQPRVGIPQVASKLAAALLGGRANEDALSTGAALNQQSLKAFGQQTTSPGTPLQAAAPTSQTGDPDEQSVQPAIQRAPGQSLAQTVQASQPQSTPNPLNPWGLPAAVARNLYMNDPKAYAAYLQGPDSVQLARVAGIDSAAAARAALEKQTAIEQRPGSTTYNPLNGQSSVAADPSRGEQYAQLPDGTLVAVPIAGSAGIQGQRAGQVTAQQQFNTPREIPMGGGRTTIGYAPTPPALQNQPPAPGAAGIQPTPPGSPPGATPAAAAPGVGATPAQPPTTSAGGAAAASSFPRGIWATVPKLQIPNSPGTSSNAYDMANLNAAAAKHAELVNQYGQEASLANQQLQYNGRAMQVLPNAEVGPLSDWLTSNRQRLIQMGVPENLVPGSGTITPTLELNKYLKNAALQGARSIYGSRMTQNEVQLQTQEMSPSTHMTAAAVQSLVQQNNIQANYSKQRAADYNTYHVLGGDPQQFEAWYSQNRPLSRFAAQQLTPNTPGKDGLTPLQRLAAQPDTLPDFKAQFGWDPTQ